MAYSPSEDANRSSNGRAEQAKAAAAAPSAWTVGAWRVDALTGDLRGLGIGGELHRVEPKVAEVLVYLAGRAGQVVSRDELLSAIWPGVVVGDDALTQAIIKLRKALGDDARRPEYIETLAKRGYRLIAPVCAETPVAPAAPVSPPTLVPGAPAAEARSEVPVTRPGAEAPPARTKLRRFAWAGGALAGVVLVAGAAFGTYRGWSWPIGKEHAPHTVAETLPVIAVLPLVNASGEPTREFFSDGVSDDIIHALGRYSGLRVISRNSVQQFKRRDASARVVSNELGARYVVTGSVREIEGQVRVGVELSDAQTARVLWSERFDRAGGEVFEIQDDIVRNIVGALAVKVTDFERERSASRPPSSLEAYDLVLLARSLHAQAGRAANRHARGLVAKARELAPDYAMAYVVESELEEQRADLGWMEDPAQGLLLAEHAARQALRLNDPGASARAHAQLARIHGFRREHDLALAESQRALALNPSDTFIAEAHGQTLLWLGRSAEAITLLETAMRLDPAGRRSGPRLIIVGAYFTADRYAQALAACDRALADNPELAVLHAMRAAILAQLDRVEEARQSAAELRRLQPNFPVAEFGGRFADPALTQRWQDAFRKAGL